MMAVRANNDYGLHTTSMVCKKTIGIEFCSDKMEFNINKYAIAHNVEFAAG